MDYYENKGEENVPCYWYRSKLLIYPIPCSMSLCGCQEKQVRAKSGGRHTHTHTEEKAFGKCAKTKSQMENMPLHACDGMCACVRVDSHKSKQQLTGTALMWPEKECKPWKEKNIQTRHWNIGEDGWGGQKVMQHRKREREQENKTEGKRLWRKKRLRRHLVKVRSPTIKAVLSNFVLRKEPFPSIGSH